LPFHNLNPSAQDGFQPESDKVSRNFTNCLDLCAGCGVQGIVAVSSGLVPKATLVERNPRAARFARFNAVLNGLNGIQDRALEPRNRDHIAIVVS
jgi:methylase of polypeptide subunit release factors